MTHMRSVDVDINNVKIYSKGLKCYFYYWAWKENLEQTWMQSIFTQHVTEVMISDLRCLL